MKSIKVGLGYDIHRLATGEDLVIGGISVAHDKGTIAHSDGDVLVHAICDALLGAAALGDIGKHFPDNDKTYNNIDSCVLLDKTCRLVKEKNYRIGNIDSTISLQKPKIAPYIDDMRSKLSKIIGIDIDDISIKATTGEKLGFVGREEGVEAYAVVLIYRE